MRLPRRREGLPRPGPGFEIACIHCGFVPARDVTMGVMQAHMLVEHGTSTVGFELVWLGPGPSLDPRWAQCSEPRCYRGCKAAGVPHDGAHWLREVG